MWQHISFAERRKSKQKISCLAINVKNSKKNLCFLKGSFIFCIKQNYFTNYLQTFIEYFSSGWNKILTPILMGSEREQSKMMKIEKLFCHFKTSSSDYKFHRSFSKDVGAMTFRLHSAVKGKIWVGSQDWPDLRREFQVWEIKIKLVFFEKTVLMCPLLYWLFFLRVAIKSNRN